MKRKPAPKNGGNSALLKRTAMALLPARTVERMNAMRVTVSGRLFFIFRLPGQLLVTSLQIFTGDELSTIY
jgi:hypothetical protein